MEETFPYNLAIDPFLQKKYYSKCKQIKTDEGRGLLWFNWEWETQAPSPKQGAVWKMLPWSYCKVSVLLSSVPQGKAYFSIEGPWEV